MYTFSTIRHHEIDSLTSYLAKQTHQVQPLFDTYIFCSQLYIISLAVDSQILNEC